MATIETNNFFESKREYSEIKSEILIDYCKIWFEGLFSGKRSKPAGTALYIDLHAGEACPEDGKVAATPLRVLHSIYKSHGSRYDLNKSVQAFFNDPDKAALASLQDAIEGLPYYEELVHKPVVLLEDADAELLRYLLHNGCPALLFTNPFRYTFSHELLLQTLTTGETDLLMLFSPDEIMAAVKNSKADNLTQEIFGDRLYQIRAFYKENRNTEKREEYLLDIFEGIFQDRSFGTVRFRINLPDRKHTSHYLIFASKADSACTRLKEMMVKYSEYQEDGVPLFGANLNYQQMSLFHDHYKFSIESLKQDLLQKAPLYHNMALQQVYEKHNVGTHYMLENYKVAYEQLMRQGLVRFYNPKTGQSVNKPAYTSLVRYK
jgi:three-Cys-motif partner protein